MATLYVLVINNSQNAASISVAQGASDAAPLGFTGTTPAVTIPAGAIWVFHYPSRRDHRASATNITITPAATGTVAVSFGGA